MVVQSACNLDVNPKRFNSKLSIKALRIKAVRIKALRIKAVRIKAVRIKASRIKAIQLKNREPGFKRNPAVLELSGALKTHQILTQLD